MPAGPQAIPPRIKSGAPPSLAVFAGVVLGAAVLGAGAVVFFFNPSTHGFFPACLFHQLTGLNCPGCGGTRALYALLHGQFSIALKDNALFVLSLPALAVWSAWFGLRKMRGLPVKFKISPKFLWAIFAIMLLFGVLRNLPGFEWLSP